MSMPFDVDYDTILSEILTDYKNLDSAPDTSEGSMAFIMAAVLASMIWGLYRNQSYINKQHFPDTADTDNLNHWGSIYDITRLDTDTDATYLAKILDFLRQPPAGGNALDYETWALDQDECYTIDTTPAPDVTYYNSKVKVEDVYAGPGTVGVFTIPNDETIIGVVAPVNNEENLRVATENYIESVRPLGLLSVTVISAKPQTQDVTIAITVADGEEVDIADLESAIEDELNSMGPGQTLHKSTLTALCISYGAESAIVSTPASDTNVIANTLFYRPGTITVTEV